MDSMGPGERTCPVARTLPSLAVSIITGGVNGNTDRDAVVSEIGPDLAHFGGLILGVDPWDCI